MIPDRLELLMLGGLAGTVAALVLAIVLAKRRVFSLLAFYSTLFLLESVGATVKTLLPDDFPDYTTSVPDGSLPYTADALALLLLGFLLFLYGYVVIVAVSGDVNSGRAVDTSSFFERHWTAPFRIFLALLTTVTIAAGFVQTVQRVREVGSVLEFARTAYMYRMGTATESATDTAVVVFSNILSGSAVAMFVLWVIAWAQRRLSIGYKLLVVGFGSTLFMRQWTSMMRGVIVFSVVAAVAGWNSERPFKTRKLVLVAGMMLVLLMGINFVHYSLYYFTAGWDRPEFLRAQSQLLAPHGHVATLAAVVHGLAAGNAPLGSKGIAESLLFFIPRIVWPAKLPSNNYGTLLVQSWAGLPSAFQMAVTDAGELIAHFGYVGTVGMVLYGLLYGWLDSFVDRGPLLRAALFGMLLPRVLPDSGMGINAVAITMFSLLLFLIQVYCAYWAARIWTRVVAGGVRRFRPRVTQGVNYSRSVR